MGCSVFHDGLVYGSRTVSPKDSGWGYGCGWSRLHVHNSRSRGIQRRLFRRIVMWLDYASDELGASSAL